MKILFFKKTTDDDLYKRCKVCYRDITGEYNKVSFVTDIYEQDGVKLYHLANTTGAWMAEELKLVENIIPQDEDYETEEDFFAACRKFKEMRIK